MFQSVIENNSSLYESVYSKAEVLFSRLLGVKNQFKDWVVLGALDMEQLAEEHLHVVADWELNIKMIKFKGKEAEKLPLYACIKSFKYFLVKSVPDCIAKSLIFIKCPYNQVFGTKRSSCIRSLVKLRISIPVVLFFAYKTLRKA